MRMYNLKKISAVTLAELLISTALIGLVLLTAASLDIAARRFFSGAEEGTAAINDMSVAMEYMVRSLESAIGDFSNPAFTSHTSGACAAYTDGFKLRIDNDEDGQVSAGDTTVEFCYNASNYQILAGGTAIANRITGFTITPNAAPISEVAITLKAKDKPGGTGPELSLQGKAYLRAAPAK